LTPLDQEDTMSSIPKKIFVATDFSTTADRAEKTAYQLASWLGAELHLVHVRVILEDPLMAKEQQLEIEQMMSSTDEATREAFARDRAGEPGTTVRTHLIRSVSAAEAITETASDLDCDLIVMGTHGRRGIKHMLLGSVAENVIRSVDLPVLTVRPETAFPAHGPKRILVAHDFSERSATAVRVAGDWARAFDADVTLLHVVEPVVYPEFYAINVISDDVMTRLRDRATEALDTAAVEILGDLRVTTRVQIGHAIDTITAEAQPEQVDLAVMGTRGLTGLEQLVLGSVAEGVLRRCPVPLLTVSRES
jgi:nucleotide-binding universal stress UspA family protein